MSKSSRALRVCDDEGNTLLRVEVYFSEADGTPCVQIDTESLPEDNAGPKLRVYLNDAPTLFENPPLVGAGP